MGDVDVWIDVKGAADPIVEAGGTMSGPRLIQKTGETNVVSRNVTRRRLRFLSDLFTTIIEMRWRYNILLFLVSFAACWVTFAAVYLAIVHVHGDVDHSHNASWVPCIHNVFDVTSAVLYSFETQTTIGYGSRVIDSGCWVGVVVAMVQIYVGTLINILVTGLVFAKISRPKSRRQTLVFSQSAVVCRRDGQYQLLFRVGDMRIRSHLVGTSVRALLVRNRRTAEGEVIPLCQFSLALETDTGLNDSYIFLVWPVTIVHRIDETSPLWEMSADQLANERFEIIVILEGTVELTGVTTQVFILSFTAEFSYSSRYSLSPSSPIITPAVLKLTHRRRSSVNCLHLNQQITTTITTTLSSSSSLLSLSSASSI